MKKSISTLMKAIQAANSDTSNGTFLSIKGGMSLLKVISNNTCANTVCGPNTVNTGECTNKSCEDSTNRQCTNTSTCFA